MGARTAQLRNAFGLDDSEELYGQFSCAHTWPRWGAQFLQGQLYVFSSVMVFHANLLAVIKVVRIQFKDVQVIRKRSFMRMPNTIAVVRCDSCSGATRDDVFTSFLFASRRKAFELMVARWRAVNPEAADAYLSNLASGSGPGGSLLPGSSSSSLNGDFCRQGSTIGSDGSSTAGGGAGAGQLHFPAWREVSGAAAERLLAVPDDMALMARAVLPGVGARTLAEVLLSDQSGFLPSVYQAQGNDLVSLTPWQVCSGRQVSPTAPHVQPPPGSLTRTLQYVYSTSGPWGSIRSLVVQEQLLLPAAGGRLVLLVTQRMPDLPAGAGKCFYMTIRWDVSPAAPHNTAAAAAAASKSAPDVALNAELLSSEHPVSPQTPTAAQPVLAAAAAAALQYQQTVHSAPPAMSLGSSSHTPPPAAAYESTTDESDDDGYTSDSSLCSMQPLRITSPQEAAPLAGSSSSTPRASASSCPALVRPYLQQQQSAGAATVQPLPQSKPIISTKSAPGIASSSVLHSSSSFGSTSSSSRPLSPSRRGLSSLQHPSLHHGFDEVVERVERLPGQIRSSIKHSFKATKQGLRELRKSATKSTTHALSASPLIGAATLSSLVTRRDSMERQQQQQQQQQGRVASSPLAAGAAGSGTPTGKQQQQQQQHSGDFTARVAAEMPQQQPPVSPAAAASTQRAAPGRHNFSSPLPEQQQQQTADAPSPFVQPINCSTPVSGAAATAAGGGSAAGEPNSSQVSFGVLGLASASSTPTLTPVRPLHQGLPATASCTGGAAAAAAAAAPSPLGPLSQGLQELAANSSMHQQEAGSTAGLCSRSPTAAEAAAPPVRAFEASFVEAAAVDQPTTTQQQQQPLQSPAPTHNASSVVLAGQHLQDLCDAAEAGAPGCSACDINAKAPLSSRDQAAQDSAVSTSTSGSSSRSGSFTVGGSGGSGTSASSDKKSAAAVVPAGQETSIARGAGAAASPAPAAMAAATAPAPSAAQQQAAVAPDDGCSARAGTAPSLAEALTPAPASAPADSTPAAASPDAREGTLSSLNSTGAGSSAAAGPRPVRGTLSATPEVAGCSRQSAEASTVAAAVSPSQAATAQVSVPAAKGFVTPAAAGVQWQVRASVTFTKWHMVQSKIENDCVATASSSLANIVAQGSAWLADEGQRCSLAEVMPQAAAAVAAAAVQRHQPQAGGRQLLRGQGVHRRSGSTGSSAALRLASSGKPGGHLARSSSSNSIALASNAAVGAATAAPGAGSRLVAVVLAVLAAVVRFTLAAGRGVNGCLGAVAGTVKQGGGQQVVVLGVLVVVAVQVALLWQVVALQQRVVDLLQLQQQGACSTAGMSGV